MSGRPQMKMDLGRRRERPRPRLPGLRTPSTPGQRATGTPTPGSAGIGAMPIMSPPYRQGATEPPLLAGQAPPTVSPPPDSTTSFGETGIEIELEKLTVGDEKYKFQVEDLEERGHMGDGAFGTVMKMYHPPSKTEMAVKRIPVRELRGTDKKEIVELAIVMQSGNCPYIVSFYGCLIRDGEVWICMELMDSSMDKIAERVIHKLHSRIPEEILGKMTVSVIKALSYLKKELKIIHRDIKPSNILISLKGEFKLCDFGISGRLVDSIARTMEVGCRPYMAPERIDPDKAKHGYTIQSDVWSFGITLLELILGTFPYGKWSTIFEQLNAVVNGPAPKLPNDGRFSQELQEFSAACLIKDKDRRPNYDQLQEYKFFKLYDKARVDVAVWYKSIRGT